MTANRIRRFLPLVLCLLLATAAWRVRVPEKVMGAETFCVPFANDPIGLTSIAWNWVMTDSALPRDAFFFQIDPSKLPADLSFVPSRNAHLKEMPLEGHVHARSAESVGDQPGGAVPPNTLRDRADVPQFGARFGPFLAIVRRGDTDLVQTYWSLHETHPRDREWTAWRLPKDEPLTRESLEASGKLLAHCHESNCMSIARYQGYAISYSVAEANLPNVEKLHAAVFRIVDGWRCGN